MFVNSQTSYAVFLRQAFAELETQEVNYAHFPQVTSSVTSSFSRAYFALYENRKHVIKTFSSCDNFDNEAAATLLYYCESRRHPKPTPKEKVDATVYERLADIANRFRLFTREINGVDLQMFRDGTLRTPLITDNVAKAAFFLALLGEHKKLPYFWKQQAQDKELLVSSTNGKPQKANYLRSIASYRNAKYYANTVIHKSKYRKLTAWEEIAYEVNNAAI